jgi:hypothetical protein
MTRLTILYTSKSASPILFKLESVSNQMSHKDYNQYHDLQPQFICLQSQ